MRSFWLIMVACGAVLVGSLPAGAEVPAPDPEKEALRQDAPPVVSVAALDFETSADGLYRACTDQIAVQVAPDGRFNIGSGAEEFTDPDTGVVEACRPLVDAWDLSFSWPFEPWSSYTTVRLDGSDVRLGIDVLPEDVTVSGDVVRHRYRVPSPAPSGFNDVEVTQEIRLDQVFGADGVENTVQASYLARPVSVFGDPSFDLRVMIDTELNYNDGAPFQVPGVGSVTTEREFSGAQIPDYFLAFEDFTDPVHISAAVLKAPDENPPDRLILGRWPGLYGSAFDYVPDPTALVTFDSAYAVFFSEPAGGLSPLGSRFITRYGRADVSADLTPPVALSFVAPSEVPRGQDFVATAFVTNIGAGPATGGSIELALPAGMSSTDPLVRALPDPLAPGETAQVTWTVRAGTNLSLGEQVLAVSVTAAGTGVKTVERTIEVVPGASGAPLGTCPFCGFSNDPVNTASGNLIQDVSDVSFGSVFGLEFSRFYNSQDDLVGPLGRGWTFAHGAEVLGEAADGSVTVRMGDGRHAVFAPDGAGGFTRPDSIYADLVEEADGSFRLVFFDGTTWVFDLDGRLVGLSSWDGQSVSITQGADGPASIVSSTGDSIALGYTSGRLTSITADDGRTVSYGYDAAGLLVSVTDASGGVTTYAYTPEEWLESVTDPEGVVEVFNVYDASGRVVSQSMPGGQSATFAYDDTIGETTVTFAPSGEVFTYRHDPQGRLIALEDPFGNAVDMSRRADGELVGATSRLGESLSQTFDDHGNVLTSETTTGGTTTYTYDSLDRLMSVTEPFGATTTYVYEGSERVPSTITDALGDVTTLDVVDGLVVSITDPDGVSTSFAYDSERRLVSETNGVGDVTAYAYDGAGRLSQITSPLGNVTSFTYDAEGRLVSSTDPTGAVTTNVYDAAGRLVSVTDPEGAVTSYDYDAAGRMASMTDSRGEVTTYAYDEFDQLTSTTRPGASVSQNTWAELGRLESTIDPLSRVTGYGYDVDGNRVTTTDPTGDVTSTTRDSAGRVTSVTDPLGRTTTTSYDGFGRLASTADATGATTSYGYDGLGRVETVTDPRGGSSSTTFTAAGRIATSSDANGNTVSYTYDGAGRISSVTDPEGGVTSSVYDADGRVVQTTSPAGLVTSMTYDAAGRPLTVTDPAGVSTVFAYDSRGDLVSVQRDGEGVRLFDYDDRDLLSVTDALGNATGFSYDGRGNRTGVTDALGRSQSATFNAADERTSATDALGRKTTVSFDGDGRTDVVSDPSGRTVDNAYDAAGQLVSQSFADGTLISYTYDDAGRRSSMTDPSGVTSYVYDPAGNLTQVTYPNGDVLAYAYDAGGRRTQMTYPDGSTVSYGYDSNDRLTSVAHSGGGTVTYGYDADGRLLSEILSDGTSRTYTYTGGRLASFTQNGVTTTVSYDAAGRISSTSGGENQTFSYDAGGQLTAATGDGDSYAYGYDEVGNLSSKDGVSFTVDAANQLSSGSDGSSFVYDEAGRLVEEVRVDGTRRGLSYDARGLLVQEVITEGGTGTVVDPCDTATPTTTGTEGDDVIVGTNGDDVIFGLGGNDEIDGGNGRDLICGGDGDDVLVDGSNSEDVLSGGPGNDRLDGGRGVDVLLGGDGDDVLSGGNGNDSLFGGAGADTLDGGQGDDTVDGGAGVDTLTGDRGNDTLQGGADADSIDGGQGEDQCEPEPGRVACELDLEPGEPARTVYTRSYDGDGLLVQVAVTHPDATVDVYGFTWDKTLPVPQIVSYTVNGESTSVVYGANRALAVDSNGTASGFEYSVLGDTIGGFASVASGFDPYGQPDTAATTVGFGYRGELHVGDLVYLRFRDLDPGLGRFTTVDPLDGVPGTTTVANQYAYAANDPVGLVDPWGLRPKDRSVRKTFQFGDSFYDGFERLGVLEVAGFIPERESRFLGLFTLYLGDGRGFEYPPPTDRSRFYASVDFATGETYTQVNSTCSPTGECWPAWPVKTYTLAPQSSLGDWPQNHSAFSFFVSPGNVFSLQWSVVHGDRRTFSGIIPTELVRPSFDGAVLIRWLTEDALQVTYEGDCFPNVEAYVTLDDGTAIAVLRIPHRGTEQGVAIAGNCKVTATGQIP